MAIAADTRTEAQDATAAYLRDLLGMASDHSESVRAAHHKMVEHVFTQGPEERERGQQLANDLEETALIFAARIGPVLVERARVLAEAWGDKWSEDFLNDHATTHAAAAYLRPLFEAADMLYDFR